MVLRCRTRSDAGQQISIIIIVLPVHRSWTPLTHWNSNWVELRQDLHLERHHRVLAHHAAPVGQLAMCWQPRDPQETGH